MPFSQEGAGDLLHNLFNREVTEHSKAHNAAPGTTLLVVSDFGGSDQGQLFETYSFLFMVLEHNRHWLQAQKHFREHVIRSPRRIAYKALSDKIRRAAMPAFLEMGSHINGSLITFAISRNRASLFALDDLPDTKEELLAAWSKKRTRERLMRVLHLGAFLLSGLSAPDQNLLWLTDEDEIASNETQLRALTKAFGNIASNSLSHSLGHIRCGTAKSDDGSKAIEDALAYADLAAGGVAEVLRATDGGHVRWQKYVASPLPKSVSWKARGVVQWLSETTGALKRHTCVMDLKTRSPGMTIRMLKFHSYPQPTSLILPR